MAIKNYQNFLLKGFKHYCIGMNLKQKVGIKIQQTSIDIFSNQPLYELTNYLFLFIQTEIKMKKGVKPEGINSQKVLSRITTSSSMEKTFMVKQLILM